MSIQAPHLTATQERSLRDIFPGDSLLLTPEQTLIFATDAGRRMGTPLAVVRPTTEAQVVELLRLAQAEHLPVYARGRASNQVGACVPARPGIVVSLLHMNRILDIADDDFVAEVEPGVVTSDLQRAVEARGLFYPPDPASIDISTIGGNVATCAGGMRALKYGVTREYVLGLTAVLPGGKVLHTGGRCHKNVVGLDLTRLFVGSEGTLGIVTRITLKLLPLPQATATLLAGFGSMEAAMHGVRRIFRAGILPVALEFLSPEVLDCVARRQTPPWPDSVRGALLIRLDGSRESLPLEVRRMHDALHTPGDAAEGTPGNEPPVWSAHGVGRDEEEPLWAMRRGISPSSYLVRPNKIGEDIAVPRGRLLDALTGIRAIAEAHDLPILTYGHVGDGNIHVNIMYDGANPSETTRADAATVEVMRLVRSMDGTLSGEHGVGMAKKEFLHLQLSPLETELMHQVKHAFDPLGIMNPDKAY